MRLHFECICDIERLTFENTSSANTKKEPNTIIVIYLQPFKNLTGKKKLFLPFLFSSVKDVCGYCSAIDIYGNRVLREKPT